MPGSQIDSRPVHNLDQFVGQDMLVKIVKVNVDDNPSLVGTLQIKSVPTLLFYSGRSAAPLAIVGATTARTIVSRFRLDELPLNA